MTELPATGLAITSSQLLAWIASALLVFVSAGVIYLSVVEWRDRRRRRADESAAGKSTRGSRKSAGTSSSAGSTPPRSPAAFGRRP
ncbi:hypothetical protein KBY96_05085 [Cyanobium sp. ATX 6A2]|uniref:hypothetical protein n=1 Tax=Cyanobium sp. ATX 6A2 TaxID=2823700 RepID=UPI0020CEAAF1|nr:hypothetical protein [Cyanobium sp. ATX 6A2]MCP9887310.1 hypothetical protein [Cyanobium sp. ATX 6A2]